MTRTILVLRHAKSDQDAGSDTDHGRPLASRGRKAAARVGSHLASLEDPPGFVLCSSAVRAQQTLQLALDRGRWPCVVEITDALYDTTADAVLELLGGQDDARQSVLLVGHEPTWSELVAALTGGRVQMPTAALARIDVEIERWKDLAPDTGRLVWLVTPKLLREIG